MSLLKNFDTLETFCHPEIFVVLTEYCRSEEFSLWELGHLGNLYPYKENLWRTGEYICHTDEVLLLL